MHGVESYMRYADLKLREEELRAQKYLEPNSASIQRLTDCCVKVLVATFKPAILAECPQMIQHHQTDSECRCLFMMFDQSYRNTHTYICVIFITLIINNINYYRTPSYVEING